MHMTCIYKSAIRNPKSEITEAPFLFLEGGHLDERVNRYCFWLCSSLNIL